MYSIVRIYLLLLATSLKQPLISPLYANLSALPPLLVHVGAAEVLLDDSLQLEGEKRPSDGATQL
ncbi:MAG: alpha/beta hydrolase fold domain-containing protein [Leptolyngbyaceae cyanobacterium]